eukprot:CAMPEP_0203670904 /NCGR_PEP_ID=MMETSP0090-20130426/6861_1 /ASSEMBLY_ACC=CAM_ASM_001088 /TAXON_ID=426623 /ORGANISM="Chaetoceros affinis, Strain CCMP159" /LENGTH=537 /DNA_ID=CAMNT_0050535881 /DNA_START=38 /DNA_END=1651 /DNA_ORIENTATION=+
MSTKTQQQRCRGAGKRKFSLLTILLVVPVLTILPQTASSFKVPGQCPVKVPPSHQTTSPILLSSSNNLIINNHQDDDSKTNAKVSNNNNNNNRRPGLQVIAHRGGSFSLPEHTIAGYRLALELGADYIEPDIVSTKDGTLVAVHDVDLNITTNVADVYPGRNSIEGVGSNVEERGGYFVYDFTYDEIKELRVKQRLGDYGRSRQFDGIFPIPTLREIFDLLYEWNTQIIQSHNETRRSGVYVELKKPEVHLEKGIDLVELLMAELQSFPYSNSLFFGNSLGGSSGGGDGDGNGETTFGCEDVGSYDVPTLVIQCFHGPTIQKTAEAFESNSFPSPPFIYLVNKRCHESDFWQDVKNLHPIVSGIGPNKECLVGESGEEFMSQARDNQLAVHAWTTREEVDFVMDGFSTAEEELRFLYCHVGIDGIFTESVDLGVRVGVRGCDDFNLPIELWSSYIAKYEEEKGLKKSALGDQSCSDSAFWSNLLSWMFGLSLGMVGAFLIAKWKVNADQKRRRTKHQSISQDDSSAVSSTTNKNEIV